MGFTEALFHNDTFPNKDKPDNQTGNCKQNVQMESQYTNYNIRIRIPTFCSMVNLFEHIRSSCISIGRSGTTDSFLASGMFSEIALSCRHFKIVFNINRYKEKNAVNF
jgi:hypothetical protein